MERVDMIIKAIEDTIELHKEAIERDMSYLGLKFKKRIKCPLCKTAEEISNEETAPRKCKVCPWVIFTGNICSHHPMYDMEIDSQSIARLELWKNVIIHYPNTYLANILKVSKKSQ